MKKVVLLELQLGMNPIFTLPLGYLKSYSYQFEYIKESFDIEIRLYPRSIERMCDISRIINYLFIKKPDIIGFSCYTWNIEFTLSVVNTIKKILPNSKIILGGPQVDENIMHLNFGVDFIVHGEGEITFKKLLDYFLNRIHLKDISAITYRKGDKIITNPKENIVKNLDEIPSPYFLEPLKLNQYVIYLETSRGCPFNCNYCYYHKGERTIRYFSLEYIEKVLKKIFQEFLFQELYLLDPSFTFNKERAIEICKLIAKYNKYNVKIHIETNPEFINNKLITYFKMANVDRIELGIQSIDKDVLKNCNRVFNKKKFLCTIKLLESANISYEVQLMDGLPGDNFFKSLYSLYFVINNCRNQKMLFKFALLVLNKTAFFNNSDLFGIKYSEDQYSFCIKTCSQDYKEIYKNQIFFDCLAKEFKW